MRKKYKGSITIEMTCILPLFALVFVFGVWGSFYYHDKSILSSCAYETAVMGSTKVREKETITEGLLKEAFQERIRGKCILFSSVDAMAQIDEEAVVVKAQGQRKNMKTAVVHTAAVTEPESYIRKMRKLK